MSRDPEPCTYIYVTKDTDPFSWCRNNGQLGYCNKRQRPEPWFRNKGERFKIRIQELDQDTKHGYKKRDPEPP